MRVGFLGAGKLGGVVALAMESKGHDVLVCDKADWVRDAFDDRKWPHKELGVPELMKKTKISCVPIKELIQHSEIIFVAVQTPHEHQYGGAVPLPPDRKDFDYTALKAAITELVDVIRCRNPVLNHILIAVISTVLPGTIRREILPGLTFGIGGGAQMPFVYCPFFAAMGTVVEDVLDPEFVLLGKNTTAAHEPVKHLFEQLHKAPIIEMSIESAELAKVAYNTFIEMKVTWANTVMEIAHKTPGCSVDEVTFALKQATDRLVSTRYMDGGVVGGGGCHPRDNIAMSWLAKKLDIRSNFFESVMQAREEQASWLVDLFIKEAGRLPLLLFGKSYKPESELMDGSAGLLMGEILSRKHRIAFHHYDPFVDGGTPDRYLDRASAYLICTKHPCFAEYKFPPGSVVVDPFRVIPERDGVRVVAVGRGK